MAEPHRPSAMERVRVAGAVTFLVLMAGLTVSSVLTITPNVDLGVFGTLMGGFLACVAAGPVIKFVGSK